MNYRLLLVAAVAIAAAWAGIYAARPTAKLPENSSASAQKLTQLSLSTPEGTPVSLKQWQGKVIVVNFWASWCAPCREEMPAFSRIHEKLQTKGVQFVGIGIDTPDNIQSFSKTTPVSYPLWLGNYETLRLTAEIGNKAMALPFTAIINRKGEIDFVKLGKMDEAELEQRLTPLLQ